MSPDIVDFFLPSSDAILKARYLFSFLQKKHVEESKQYLDENFYLYLNNKLYSVGFHLKTLEVPKGMKTFQISPWSTFFEWNEVENIIFPEGLENLKWGTFEPADCVRVLKIPSTVKNISDGWFKNFPSLEKVVFFKETFELLKKHINFPFGLTEENLDKMVELR